MDSTVIRVLT